MNKILEIIDLSAEYEKNNCVLRSVNLSVFETDFLGIIGPNGGGKTSLVKAIMGLVEPVEGKILFYKNGLLVSKLNIGYMPQINKMDEKFPISVREVILSGLTSANAIFNKISRVEKERVEDVAEQMGLKDLLNRPIGKLSGGQLQRVLLGRSIVDNPDLLILDEPNSYVDKKFESDFYKILRNVNENTAIILVSHDIGTVLSLVKNIACVNEEVHYHEGTNVSQSWLERSYSYPVELIGHSHFDGLPKRLLHNHGDCDCCKEKNNLED